jgi:hypothetical protein
MEFSCNIDDLDELGLSFTEYLILYSLYNTVVYRNIEISPKVYEKLESKDYIVKNEEQRLGWELTQKGVDFFNSDKSLFNTFIEIFPTRATDPVTGSVRILSPAKADTIAGKKLKKKWDLLTKGKVDFEEHIIKCLQAEVTFRKEHGSLHWMRNVETWLNNGTWEDYVYLLDKKNTPSKDIRL